MTDENVVPDWAKEVLPEALHTAPFLKDTADAAAFMSNLKNAGQHMGNSIRIPGEDAGEADWKAFNDKLQTKVPSLVNINNADDDGVRAALKQLGLPDEATGYQAAENQGWLADAAHEAGLTKNQFTKLVAKITDANKANNDNAGAKHQESLDALYQEWGLAKSKNIENIQGLAKLTDAPEAMLDALEKGHVDAETMKWMSDLASKFAQSSNFAKDKNEETSITPIEAEAQIQEILNNPEYWAQGSAIGAQLRKKMLDLQQARTPTASRSLDDLRSQGDISQLLGNI